MKNTIALLSILILAAPSAFASGKSSVIKHCRTALPNLESGEKMEMTFKVIQLKDGTLTSATTTPGTNRPLIEDVTVEENPVRAGLTSDTSPDELNFSEALVVHAMSLTQDKEMAELKLSVGLDLSQVRSAKTYTIGKKTGFGSATIVEARDANGQPLGSFLGGFLVGACQ